MGHKAVQAILDARQQGGRFRDIYDFTERVDLTCVNKGVIEFYRRIGFAVDDVVSMGKRLGFD